MTQRNINIVFSCLIALILMSSCGRDNGGQLIGSQERPKWKGTINPYGMVYVPSGYLNVGQSDQDIFSAYTTRPKSISITGFYMDETEISNNEYRQFVEWVRDAKGHEIMGDYIEDNFGNEEIDWEMELDYESEDLDEMFFSKDMALSGRRELNPDLLEYTYDWINWKKAASGNYAGRRSEVIEKKTVNIVPDPFVWIRDFSYSYNEPMTRHYFDHAAFDDYPVVGVTWPQAQAFCHWRTKIWNDELGDDQSLVENFRLPTEFEWEYASRGGHDLAPYPWGGYYVRNSKGCLLANFKPGRGNYAEDGGMHTVPVDSYFPNDYGLYNMAGNVSEWTETTYTANAYQHIHDLNPDLKYNAKDDDPAAFKLKVVRGGSWKDIYYFLQTGTRDREYQDSAKSYIGFRCAMTFLGRSIDDF